MQIRNLKRFVMDKLGATYRPSAAPVTRSRSIGIVGAGPAGLVAAHDLCVAGYAVHVYEMTDRLGGMMIWGIPAFRLPPGIIDEDVERLMQRCPGLEVHLDTALGRDVSLAELKERHDAVLLTIGAWWGKPMGIAGEEDERVVDGVGFLRRVNAGERLDLDIPFFVAGYDAASEELKVVVDRGVAAVGAAYLGATRPGPNAPWLQLCEPGRDAPSHDAAGVVYRVGERWHPMPTARARAEQILGLLLASRRDLEDAIVYALERGFDLLVLDGTGALGGEWPELRAVPDLALVHETIATLRRLKKEEMIDIAWFGGARSGTDAAKLVGLGVNAIGYGVAVALALGGEITHTGVRFAPDRNEEERAGAVVNILKANAGEASMMAPCAPARPACTTSSPRTCARSPEPLPPPPASRSRGHRPRSRQVAPLRGCGRPECPESDLAA